MILSAGAIGTPQLLMLSGIGPAEHLREVGVEVQVDNPHVGSHYQDHPFFLLNWETTAKGTLAEAESPKQLLNFLLRLWLLHRLLRLRRRRRTDPVLTDVIEAAVATPRPSHLWALTKRGE